MEQDQSEQGADARGRQRGQNRQRMNVAFIEDAQDKIDRNQRRGNQHRLVCQGGLERLGSSLICGLNTGRHSHLVVHFVYGRDGVTQGCRRSQVERERNHWKLTLVVHRDGNGCRLQVREAIEWDLAAIRKRRGGLNRRSAGSGCAGPDKQIAQAGGILLEAGLHFQHHMVLVQLSEHGRHFALAVGVV